MPVFPSARSGQTASLTTALHATPPAYLLDGFAGAPGACGALGAFGPLGALGAETVGAAAS